MKIRSFALVSVGLLGSNSQAADIVETAVGAGNFKTLAAALGVADLVETLKGDGPFTVFAPTDAAFSNTPSLLRSYRSTMRLAYFINLSSMGRGESSVALSTFPERVPAESSFSGIFTRVVRNQIRGSGDSHEISRIRATGIAL